MPTEGFGVRGSEKVGKENGAVGAVVGEGAGVFFVCCEVETVEEEDISDERWKRKGSERTGRREGVDDRLRGST